MIAFNLWKVEIIEFMHIEDKKMFYIIEINMILVIAETGAEQMYHALI